MIYVTKFILLALFLVQPQFVISGLLDVVGYEKIISIVLCVLLLLIIFTYKQFTIDKVFFTIMFIQIFFLLLHSTIHQDLVGNLPFIGKLTFLPIIIFALNIIGIKKASDLFVKLVLLLSVVGFIDFIVKLFGLNISHFVFMNYGGHELSFSGLSTAHTNGYQLDGFSIYRSTYFFDEPGTYAFMMSMALCLNIAFCFNKKREYSLLLLGVCSFSLYYFVIVCLYLLFILRRRKYVLSVVLVLSFVTVFALISDNKISKVVEFANNQFFVRIVNTIDQNNRQAGITRSLNIFVDNLMFGGGRMVTGKLDMAGSSYARFFGMFGFIGAFILLLHIIYSMKSIYSGRLRLFDKFFIIASVILMLIHREHVIQLGAYSVFYLLYKHHDYYNYSHTS
jgi:hypothetical protein